MEIALNRLRLRKKCWRNPATIFTDNQKFGEDISIYGNWEVFIEILPDADLFCDSSQLALYTRRWRPSRCTIDSFVEVILDNSDVDELKQKLSKLSGIDADSIEFAKGQGTFPCEATVLNISTYLDWNPNVTSLNASPLYISDDGHVIYYRDKDEKERELTEDERNKLTNKESVKQTKMAGTTYSPRKEKALKIYTDTTTSKNTPNNDFA
ncbi:USP47 (predicted) [Pycnogonum litorale]